ncbi:Transient receptor potential cation channel protein painless [Pseudolycoriella hygida]|uniref:Transient receptor potential cation channel protein painless n=1 Tax=Pseudolycoriella hygida TaxID=35572 RepID=A0A9Q0MQN2_9DIPT|nr:Transient receptor potential cation channel protein painless [Pseudolycoriella hygida]
MSISNDLLGAFEQRNVGKFQEALEVYRADPNYLDKTKERTVFEIILSTPNSSKFIKLCVENGADFYMKNTNDQYPLHCVIESRCLDNLKQVQGLLNYTFEDFINYSPYVNVKLDNGQNSLHILADALTSENSSTVFEMMKILLSYGCNTNFPNYDGKTAFFLILEKLPKLSNRNEILDYFLENADIDFYTHRGEEIVEMVLNQKLKFEFPERENVLVNFDALMELLTSMDVNRFETLFSLFKTTCADAEIYADYCSMFLEVAVERSLINIVDLLIDYGVDINKVASLSKFKIPPTCKACAKSNPGILRLFLLHPKVKLSYGNDVQRNTLLHHFFDDYKKMTYSMFRRMGSYEMSLNQKKCFDLLMAHPKWNRDLTNSLDSAGLPAIYYSVRYKKDYITLQLLKNGAYIGTAVKGIRKSLLEEFLNSTISTNDRFNDDDDLEIRIDYNFLAPPFKDTTIKKRQIKLLNCPSQDQYVEEMKPLKKIAETAELRQLLSHPTIASFILLKWNKLSFVVYSNLVLVVLFMISFIPFTVLCQTIPVEEQSQNVGFVTFQVLSLIVLSLMILREVTQAMLSLKLYFLDVTNWVDIFLMISALIILLIETQIPNHLSRLLRTLVILLAAAEYFNVLGMVPILSVSIYTKMFKRVCKTFVKSLAFYSVMILAFAFSFYSMQGDKFTKDLVSIGRDGLKGPHNDIPATNATRNERYNNFYTVGSSIIKTLVMLTGELEGSYVHTEGFAYALLFLVFIFLVSIVLYNLLNALAVSDTQEIRRDAKLIDLQQRIKTMQASEEAIFKRNSKIGDWLKMVISLFPRSLPEGSVTIRPNRSYRIFIKQNEPIILNDWLHTRFKFLQSDVTINYEIMKEVHDILTKRREEKYLSGIRLLKENRNTKLSNDVIKISELVHSIQLNVTKLQADLYSISKRVTLP